MNKAEYIAQLKHRLQRLPKEDYQNAIMYYEEYFEDAGVEHEQEVIASLGDPATVAAILIGESAMKEAENGTPPTTKKSMNAIWVTLLAVFASPIALPIAIAFAAIIFSLIVVLFSVLFSIAVAGIACTLSGLAAGILSLIYLPTAVSSGLFALGTCLVVAAVGILLLMLSVLLFRLSFKGIAKITGNFLVRKNRKNRVNPQQYYMPQQNPQSAPPQVNLTVNTPTGSYTNAMPQQFTQPVEQIQETQTIQGGTDNENIH